MTKTNQNRPAGGNASGRTTPAWRRAIAAAFPHTVPVLTGYLVLGAAYGVLMQSKGLWRPLGAAYERGGLLRQHAVCGHHPADLGL